MIRFVILLLFSLICYLSKAQFVDKELQLRLTDNSLFPDVEIEGGDTNYFFENVALNELMNDYNLRSFRRVFRNLDTEDSLMTFVDLRCDCDENELMSSLDSINDSISYFEFILRMPKSFPTHTPNDYGDTGGDIEKQPALEYVRAKEAWDITTGDPNVNIAIVELGGYDASTHEDIQNDISYVEPGANLPSSLSTYGKHGNQVAGFASASTNNGKGISAIGYNTSLMLYGRPASNSSWSSVGSIIDAVQRGADVISLSFGSLDKRPAREAAIKYAYSNDVIVIASAGNGACMERSMVCGEDVDCEDCNIQGKFCNNETIQLGYGNCKVYPAALDETISVTSIGHRNEPGYISWDNKKTNWKDYHGGQVDDPYYFFHTLNYNDISAPGWYVYTTSINDGYTFKSGTSFSAPMVAGACALVASTNSCLSARVIENIVLQTANDDIYEIPHNQQFGKGLGEGKLDAYAAVKYASEFTNSLDLFLKDRDDDWGDEDGPLRNTVLDESPDIWIRNQPDGRTNQVHQDPEFQNGDPVWVYVRVRNKSCSPSNGEGSLALYWTKSASSSSWPQNWDGTDPDVGNLIGKPNIPLIMPGEEFILQFEWNLSEDANPYLLNNWSSCLLARIEDSQTDPITNHPNRLFKETFFNNNIAIKNVTIVDLLDGKKAPGWIEDGQIFYPHGRNMYVGNSTNQTETYDIEFEFDENHFGSTILDEAEVTVSFDDDGWELVEDIVNENPSVDVVADNTIQLLDDSLRLTGVTFPANTRHPIYVGASYLVDSVSSYQNTRLHVNQYNSVTDSIIGGVHYEVRKDSSRSLFNANINATDETINRGDSVSLSASSIGEQAFYFWYDENGSLIDTNKQIVVSPLTTHEYRLGVLAKNDSYKDYDEITINVNQHWIDDISPNPVSTELSVNYTITGTPTSTLTVINSMGNTLLTQNISPTNSSATIDVTSLVSGNYTLLLNCDGNAVDSESFIVN
ncbi:S8 family serine peptidase [Salibacter halophilus]|uniref:S8 family serine peptidase n=1 Tax=Salibacter halophilus TaxID=1803916 RepID=A0A6N6M3M7_9FLAO|nr:S8 family serine peptidase [Salibacter halophilus]KAB1063829.1 S8 family serine peptidase [Salibacter halophilus]